MLKSKTQALGWTVALVLLAVNPAPGQQAKPDGKAAKQPAPRVETIELLIHPAAPPRPALKYRLLPEFWTARRVTQRRFTSRRSCCSKMCGCRARRKTPCGTMS